MYKWIKAELVNDETATDEELLNLFKIEGDMTEREAEWYVKQRPQALKDWQHFKLVCYGGAIYAR